MKAGGISVIYGPVRIKYEGKKSKKRRQKEAGKHEHFKKAADLGSPSPL